MATRHRVPSNDLENENKLKTMPGKIGLLPSQGLTRRKVLGEVTNQARLAADEKPKVKKVTTITTFKDKKPSTLSNLKPVVHSKPETKISKPEPVIRQKAIIKHEAEKKIDIYVPVTHDKVEKKTKETAAYSVHHFGLIEEKDTDPLLVPCYVNDIIYHLRNLELEYLVSDMFLAAHKTTPRMRTVLINWLVEVHLNFRMVHETLYLTVSIVDRYLQKNKTVGRENLQLVGITALFVASKYEETYAPEMVDLVYVCGDLYSQKKILQMEQSILKALDFKFGNPCSLHFLRRYSKVGKVEQTHHILAKYLLELALIEHEFSSVAPSLLACSALCMSVQLLKTSDLDDKIITLIEHVSGYTRRQMAPVIKSLSVTVLKMETSKYKAIRTKYATESNSSISSRTELKNGLVKKLAETK